MPPRRSRTVRAAQTSQEAETPRKRARKGGTADTPSRDKSALAADALLTGADSANDIREDQHLSCADAYFAAQSGAVIKGSGETLSSILPPFRADALQQLFHPSPPGYVTASVPFLRHALRRAEKLKSDAGTTKSGRGWKQYSKEYEEQDCQNTSGKWPIPGSDNAGGPLSAPILSELAVLTSETRYQEWDRTLSLGHSILLHGPGDAEAVLADYVRCKPAEGLGLAILFRAYTPGTTASLIRSLLDQLEQITSHSQEGATSTVFRGAGWSSTNMLIRARRIAAAYRLPVEVSDVPPLYLAISQVDSKLFRNPAALSVLSALAAAPSIFIIASASHINAPLLFPPSAPPLPDSYDLAPENATYAPDPPPIPWAYISLATFVPPLNAALYAAAAPRGGPLKLPAPLSLRGASGPASSMSALGVEGDGLGSELEVPTISLARTERILAALPERAIKLFSLLTSLQLSQGKTAQASEALASEDETMSPAPLSLLVEAASAEFVARDLAGLKAMLPEFTSHGVIHSFPRSAEHPEERLWIALKRQDLTTYLQARVKGT